MSQPGQDVVSVNFSHCKHSDITPSLEVVVQELQERVIIILCSPPACVSAKPHNVTIVQVFALTSLHADNQVEEVYQQKD